MLKTLFLAGMLSLTMLAMPAMAQETRSFTDDLGRIVEIPVHPQRIASLHALTFTIPLLELGVIPVGSQGDTGDDSEPHIRSGMTIAGTDFDNSDIAYLGPNLPPDFEAIAAVRPDLIIAFQNQESVVDQLELIAPTIVLSNQTGYEVYDILADITGTQDRLATLKARYESQVAQIRRIIDTGTVTVNHLAPGDGALSVWETYFNLGKVLRDAGFDFPAAVDAMEPNSYVAFSPETLPELDADILFVTYRTDQLETPAIAKAAFESVVPGFCAHLHACRNGQLIYIPREEVTAKSYDALSMLAYAVLTHISGRDIVRMENPQ